MDFVCGFFWFFCFGIFAWQCLFCSRNPNEAFLVWWTNHTKIQSNSYIWCRISYVVEHVCLYMNWFFILYCCSLSNYLIGYFNGIMVVSFFLLHQIWTVVSWNIFLFKCQGNVKYTKLNECFRFRTRMETGLSIMQPLVMRVLWLRFCIEAAQIWTLATSAGRLPSILLSTKVICKLSRLYWTLAATPVSR